MRSTPRKNLSKNVVWFQAIEHETLSRLGSCTREQLKQSSDFFSGFTAEEFNALFGYANVGPKIGGCISVTRAQPITVTLLERGCDLSAWGKENDKYKRAKSVRAAARRGKKVSSK